jgi:hypothetical protein
LLQNADASWDFQSNTIWQASLPAVFRGHLREIESSRLDFIRNNQDTVRADLYQGFVDSYRTGVKEANEVGKRIVLSPTFIGGPRDMRRWYMDAMAWQTGHLSHHDVQSELGWD